VHEVALRVLVDGLVSLGVLSGSTEELLESNAYRPYFMHRTSHWLGLDVHDSGDYVRAGQSRKLEPGMVLTIEPGLYLKDKGKSSITELEGMGVRIEDDLLVTPEGHEVLTRATPKDIEDLEELIGLD
jgi:Xaa-Pro aminopeptidase